jgi:hypothetical protein
MFFLWRESSRKIAIRFSILAKSVLTLLTGVNSMMKMLLTTMALASFATGANAITLTNAAVTGPSGTVWNTAQTGNYTLFLQTPDLGDFLNPNDESISFDAPNNAPTRILLAGEGWVAGGTADSDPFYNLTLTFSGGQTLTGLYTPSTNTFGGGSSFVSGLTTVSLTEFSFRRFLGDVVQPNVATFGGDGNDYTGNFRFTATTVPEPASWALMIGGFGMVGAVARRRTRIAAMNA